MDKVINKYFGLFCALVLLSVCYIFALVSHTLAEGNWIFAVGAVSFRIFPRFIYQFWVVAFIPVMLGGIASLWKHNLYNLIVGLVCLPSWSYVLTYLFLMFGRY